MISFASAWAIALRHLYLIKRDINILLFQLYWPLLDIMLMGFLGSWIQQSQTQLHNYQVSALLAILLWQVVGRGCNSIVLSFTEELWSNNLLSLFSLPLNIFEWILGCIINYTISMFIVTAASIIFMFMIYDISIFYLISKFLIFSPPLFFSAIWLGFTALSIITTLGKRGVELGFIIVWFFLPFSGVYYPIDVLPSWGQALSSILPMSYVFQGMRAYVINNQDSTLYLVKGYILSIIYAIIAIRLFIYSFNRAKENGLARLLD